MKLIKNQERYNNLKSSNAFKSNIQFHESLFYLFLFNCYYTAPLLTFDHGDWAASLTK